MSLAPGTTLGRYQILEPLGQGGMALVYKAYQPALPRSPARRPAATRSSSPMGQGGMAVDPTPPDPSTASG